VRVRRERRLPLEDLAPYVLESPRAGAPGLCDPRAGASGLCGPRAGPPGLGGTPAPPVLLDWSAVFGNDHPVEVEVGFGKGLFLVRSAQEEPQTNFLGIEVVRKYQLFTATRLAKRQLTNVRLVLVDARLFLRDCVPAASVQAIHVYYPDPWWKKRHEKRRVFTADFAAQCARCLRPGGRLFVVTDVEDYFRVITDLVAQNTRLRPLPVPDLNEPSHDLDYLTNFERKFRQAGRAIFRAFYERGKGGSSEGVTPSAG
jgi:tRNA (guanine-N7-)-methyltransferase